MAILNKNIMCTKPVFCFVNSGIKYGIPELTGSRRSSVFISGFMRVSECLLI